MRSLYTSANRVLVCLGDDPEELVFDATGAIKILAKEIHRLLEKHVVWGNLPEIQSSQTGAWDIIKWDALAQLSKKEWFERVWVWQEVGLAKNATVLYGDSEADWDDLMTVFKWLTHCAEPLVELHDLEVSRTNELWSSYDLKVRDYYNMDGYHKCLETFIELLESARYLKASDQRDKLYAFLGHPLMDFQVKPDYEQPVSRVYSQFVKEWINQSKCLQILSMAGRSKTVTESATDFPTWCPRWDELSSTQWPFYGYGFHAGTHRNCEVLTLTIKADELVVRGVQFGSVKTTKPDIDFLDSPRFSQRDPRIQRLYSVLDLALEIRSEFTGDDDIFASNALVSTLTGGYKYGDENGTIFESFRIYISQLLANDTKDHEEIYDIINVTRGGAQASPEIFLRNASVACFGRRFFITDRGDCGLGPDGMEAGDICVILFGGEVPFILRPCGGHYYYLLGECYVFGVMDSGARRCRLEKEEWFRLR